MLFRMYLLFKSKPLIKAEIVHIFVPYSEHLKHFLQIKHFEDYGTTTGIHGDFCKLKIKLKNIV